MTQTGQPMPKTRKRKRNKKMKKLAIAVTALSLFAAPALADTIHTDGPTNPSSKQNRSVSVFTGSSEFAATVTPTAQVRAPAAHGKKFYFGGPISGGR
jgi:uncharacterized lipoprotein YajG